VVIALLYALAAIISYLQVVPWEATRKVILKGLMVIAWLWSADRILGDEPGTEIEPCRRPLTELIWILGILAAGYLLSVDNGLIGGYLWQRTRSLPLLVILHMFAYPRFGV
jgi:hypothetical protein